MLEWSFEVSDVGYALKLFSQKPVVRSVVGTGWEFVFAIAFVERYDL